MYRERLTITLEVDLLSAIDALIDKQILRNRSQTIEYLLKEGMGLHELQQAFLFFNQQLDAKQLEHVVNFCVSNGISELLLGIPAGQTTLLHDAQTVIRQQHPSLNLIHVPTDFGTAGALVLQHARLVHPFLLLTLEPTLHVPSSILPAYSFHRQHHAPLTRLLKQDPENCFRPSGIEIASPELVSAIPAGIASLSADVFPALAKEGKVRLYVTA